jgi:hypothetical protein
MPRGGVVALQSDQPSDPSELHKTDLDCTGPRY